MYSCDKDAMHSGLVIHSSRYSYNIQEGLLSISASQTAIQGLLLKAQLLYNLFLELRVGRKSIQ